jgi:transposase
MARIYSSEEKDQILKEVTETGSVIAVANRHSMPDSTIHTWLSKRKNSETIQKNQSLRDLRKQLSERDLEISILKELLKKTNQAWLRN